MRVPAPVTGRIHDGSPRTCHRGGTQRVPARQEGVDPSVSVWAGFPFQLQGPDGGKGLPREHGVDLRRQRLHGLPQICPEDEGGMVQSAR